MRQQLARRRDDGNREGQKTNVGGKHSLGGASTPRGSTNLASPCEASLSGYRSVPLVPHAMPHALVAVIVILLSMTARAQQQVIFSEVMYNQPVGKPEFIELWNISTTPLDIEKWKLSGGIDYQFPNFNAAASQAHFILPQERIIVSAIDATATRAAYPSIPAGVRIFGPWTVGTALDNDGDALTLMDKNGVTVARLSYKDDGYWPVSADGAGHSLVLVNENRPQNDWRNWRQSTNSGGSPGVADPAPPAAGLVISEYHFSPVTGRVDWVELRNDGTTTASATGFSLASLADLSNAMPLSGSVGAGGYVSFDVDFAPDNDGDIRLFLVGTSNRVASAVKTRRIVGRDSWQVFPAGGRQWYCSPTSTRDAANNPARNTDIVINEIMADPPSNQVDAEFVELYNRGAATVDLSGWKLDDAIDFSFPPGTMLAPGAYLVIGANRSYLNSVYAGLNAIGDWSGSLGNDGQLLRLLDQFGNPVNEVDYRFGGEWPEMANGNGSSLELINPEADNRYGGAWQDSDESQKSTFQAFTINGGNYAKGSNGSPGIDDEIRIWGVSDTHVILRNIVLRPTAGGSNILVNAGVTTLTNDNVSGWQARGTHWATYHDAEGVHLVADGHGDNKCNHIEKDAPNMLQSTQYTLTFEARWVSGKSRLVAQTWDTSWGGTVRVPIPSNLGTPGAQNSRYSPNVAPQIASLLHTPAVPASGATVTVTARLSANTPVAAVQVIHRKDNISANGTWNTTAMNDSGTAGDVVAGDGVWTGQIAPAAFSYSSTGNYIAEFYVRATAANGAIAVLPRAGAAAPGLWATDSQVVATDLRRMRIVISQYWIDALNQGSGTGGHTVKYNYKYPRLANRYLPCTFISNESEIYYACTVRKTGSPWTRQTDANLARGRVTIPGDKPFRSKTKLYWDNDGGASMLHNRIVRYWLYLFGVPSNQNEVCRVTRNNDAFAVRETSEVFDKDMLDRIWEDGRDGQFFEIDDKFWIADDGSTRQGSSDGTWGYLGLDATGFDNPTWYQNNFIPKSRETDYDYGGFIEWTKQLQNASISQEACERMADTRAMSVMAAVRGYIGDWDNLTIRRGKNGYMYQRSTDRKWMLIHWDSDLAFQNTSESVLGSFAGVGTYFGRPFIRHYLNYYLTELLGPYSANGARLQAWLTAEENASTSYTANTSTYTAWSTNRAATVQAFIGAALSTTFTVSTPVNNASTTSDTQSATGLAPSSAFSVACVNHPEAILTWGGAGGNDPASWTLAGIKLKTGANTLVFRMYNIVGVQVGTDLTRTVTKTNSATPAMAIACDRPSYNVQLGEPITLDATGSTDPDGSALTFAWTVSPNSDVSTTIPLPGKIQAIFTKPGIYTLTVQATNAGASSATISRDVFVSATQDFESFSAPQLSPNFTVTNTELLDNYSPNSWYSLGTNPGNLELRIADTASMPLNSALAFPRIVRPLPVSTDFAMQTELTFQTRYFGNFFTGLYVETNENSQAVKYAFGVDGGNNLIARRAIGAANFTSIGTAVFPGGNSSGISATLRVRRLGVQLQFQRLYNGTWTTVATATMAAGATAIRGGIFAATSAAQSIRLVFDYLEVADPGTSADLLTSLRINEIMYNPPGVGGVEFIELKNVGNSPIELAGAYFEDGNPFDQFVFPTLTLQPGAYCVVTNDMAAFQVQYGTFATVAGQFAGSLSNGGERIVLKDANGNTILDFTYSDSPPWPAAADGGGRSLEIRNPANSGAYYADGANWIAGAEVGGSPGWLGMALDTDGDGQPDAYEMVFGSNPNDPASSAGLLMPSAAPTGDVTIAWSSVAGRSYTIEYTDNLPGNTWQPLANVIATGALSAYTDTTAGGIVARFYRIRSAVP
jgi:hypothetical protein